MVRPRALLTVALTEELNSLNCFAQFIWKNTTNFQLFKSHLPFPGRFKF